MCIQMLMHILEFFLDCKTNLKHYFLHSATFTFAVLLLIQCRFDIKLLFTHTGRIEYEVDD